jgi:hypothetical protein
VHDLGDGPKCPIVQPGLVQQDLERSLFFSARRQRRIPLFQDNALIRPAR